MSKKLMALFAGICLSLTLNTHANAILVGTWDFSGGGHMAEYNHALSAINCYNQSHNPDLPDLPDSALPGLLQATQPGGPKTFNWTAPDDFDFYFVISKYGQGQATFDSALHYVEAGDVISYNPGGNSAPNGLSHYSVFGANRTPDSVPDHGSTATMIGVTLVGLGFFRRSLAKK